MKEILRVSGPYVFSRGRLKGRKYLTVYYRDGTKGSMLYSRYVMEQALGYRLSVEETVDHIDEDFTNDKVENLQVLSLSENIRKSAKLRRQITFVEVTCVRCGQKTMKELRNVKHASNQGKAGPFCGRSCAGKYGADVQNGRVPQRQREMA